MRLLIVELSESIKRLYRAIFKDEEIEEASDYFEAIQKYIGFEKKPDVVISDYMLGCEDYRLFVNNGLSLFLKIKELNHDQKFVLTGFDFNDKESVEECNINAFFKKPFNSVASFSKYIRSLKPKTTELLETYI